MDMDQEFQQLLILAGRPILVEPAERTSDLFSSGEKAGLSVRALIDGLNMAGDLGSQAPDHYEMNRLIVYKNVSERAAKYRNDPTDDSWMPARDASLPGRKDSLRTSMAHFEPIIDVMYQERCGSIEAEYPGYLATLGEPMIHPGVQFELKVSLNQLACRFRAAIENVMKTAWVPENLRSFPHSCCGTISELLGEHLNSLDIGEFYYVCGDKDGGSHAWLEVYGLVVDITADQFEGRPAVYVDVKDAWYAEWEEDTKHLAIHEPSAFFYRDESQFFDLVLEHMRELGTSAG
ncbi:hypothetical protein SAMN03159437_03303 [Pseudomonas sp. NFACC25]|uniref:hypothetical protein n=1 Tax=Pseudomonas sp. NFACC25 TaxID=1566188 RepID=UPI000876C29A|nr:hypothetical protein [Pseudomonas sp. NFACC25]SCX29957.1 hypothetical protein SAMN03159437_03303 [Pseudomonas sp. NFACC25]